MCPAQATLGCIRVMLLASLDPANKQHILYWRQGVWLYSHGASLYMCLYACLCVFVQYCVSVHIDLLCRHSTRSSKPRPCRTCSSHAQGSSVITAKSNLPEVETVRQSSIQICEHSLQLMCTPLQCVLQEYRPIEYATH